MANPYGFSLETAAVVFLSDGLDNIIHKGVKALFFYLYWSDAVDGHKGGGGWSRSGGLTVTNRSEATGAPWEMQYWRRG